MKIRILVLTVLLLSGLFATSQNFNKDGTDFNTITTAVPFLLIGPDARAGGMGDGGLATAPDANSMHWNPAKYAFIDQKFGLSISYTPWLRNLVNDINLAYVSYFNRIGDMQTIAFTLRYFTLGDITFTDDQGMSLGTFKPNEFAFDGTYARILSDNLSIAVAGRFIYSDLTQGQNVQGVATKAGISVAADIALYWEKDVEWFKSMDATFAWGVNISNIGNKISYDPSNAKKDFIPTNLRVGPRLTLFFDEYNKMTFSIDVNKLLVPTPPIYYANGDTIWMDDGSYELSAGGDDPGNIKEGKDPNVPVIRGMIQSWYDAPGGFSEELREFNYAIGIEYWYNDVFALRGGFFYEDKYKGGRQYATLGVGLRYNAFGLDFSYLIPVSSSQNPLQNTLRFTLLFNFGNVTKSTAPKG
jgi:hypothetical protein